MLPIGPKVSIEVKSKAPATIDAVAVFVHEGAGDLGAAEALLSEQEQTAARRLLASGTARGKARDVQIGVVDGAPGEGSKSAGGGFRRLLVVGLGDPAKVSAETIRQAAGALAKAMRRHRLASAAVVLPAGSAPDADEANGLPAATIAEAVVEGLVLGGYAYTEYKGVASRRKDDADLNAERKYVLLAGADDLPDAKRGADRGRTIAEAQNFARTIASRPGNDINPPTLAKVAQELAREAGLGCRVMDEKELARLKMGGILAVGSGAIATPPRLIVLEWNGGAKAAGRGARGGKAARSAPVLVVGKAITFDTGGISVKPADKMGKMIFDKCGGMAVLGLMLAASRLKLPIHLVGILSSAENAISSRAYRPGDILRMHNGVTVDVTNTDAEGRLVLGDALAWGIETYKPSAVIDLATLTGAMVVALGYVYAGMYCNDDGLAAELASASESAGEKIWRMPLAEEYRERIKADAADIVNAAGRDGGCCTAAAFLSHFVPQPGARDFVPWAHFDIAGVADTEKELPYYAKGSTGWGVRTLVEWVAARAGAGR